MEVENISISQIHDISCLSDFHCGITIMDAFIHGGLQESINGLFCKAYKVTANGITVAFFALNFDSLDLDPQEIYDIVYTKKNAINLPDSYTELFLEKNTFPAVEISYLAVHKDYQHNSLGTRIVEVVKERALQQDFAGCQFVTVVPLVQSNYSAEGFYEKLGFEHKQSYNSRLDKTMYSPLRIWKSGI